jgi:hypothetical protein
LRPSHRRAHVAHGEHRQDHFHRVRPGSSGDASLRCLQQRMPREIRCNLQVAYGMEQRGRGSRQNTARGAWAASLPPVVSRYVAKRLPGRFPTHHAPHRERRPRTLHLPVANKGGKSKANFAPSAPLAAGSGP